MTARSETAGPEQRLLSQRFSGAARFASELHAAQKRKGTSIPYVAHLMSASAVVLEHGGSEDQAIAALLHDAIEDPGHGNPDALRRDIRERFGARQSCGWPRPTSCTTRAPSLRTTGC